MIHMHPLAQIRKKLHFYIFKQTKILTSMLKTLNIKLRTKYN